MKIRAGVRAVKSGSDRSRAYRRDSVATMVPGISERSNGATRFLHLDRLGTNARTTDASGSVVGSAGYDAFGQQTQYGNAVGSQAGFASAFGYQEDGETNLKLLGHRYYDPGSGRFITRDHLQDGSNWYAYCDNNPLSNVDATGNYLQQIDSPFFKPLGSGGTLVPSSPSSDSLRDDLDLVSLLQPWARMIYIGWKYMPHHGWDWKPKYRAYGNFHYGAMLAMMGFSLNEAYYWAGVAEWNDGDARDARNQPASGFPYGEEADTLYWVRQGWWYWHNELKKGARSQT